MLLLKRIATVCLVMFLIGTSTYAQQQEGRVIDRNGAPQGGCQINFFVAQNQPPVYRATSNNDGSFYLNNAEPGRYYVVVRSGQQQFSVTVIIDGRGLQPSTLIATW